MKTDDTTQSNNTTQNSKIWSDSVLMARIETFGYQMAEMGRQQAFESEARNTGDYDGARMYADRAEMYRQSANTLKTDINAQLTLRHSNTLVTA